MRWNERQLAMLGAMGLRLWLPPDAPAANGDAAEATARQIRSGDVGAVVAGEASVAVAAPPPAAFDAAEGRTAAAIVAAMDWPTLRQTVAGCTACRLCESRRQTVFGIGHERAHWMIIGEAPGEQEDRQGEPFVGKSGQLLDNMLRSIGLGRGGASAASSGLPAAQNAAQTSAREEQEARQVYICNTIKCRPPGNRNPQADELARCEAYLIRQVELVQPRIILAMGRFAVQSLLRSSEPIGRLRGRVHRYLGVPLIVTYHPAYLLRNPEDKAKAWDDLCLAVAAVQSAVGV